MAGTSIKHRRDTASNWGTNNPILGAGEFAINTDDMSFRIGDGTHNWSALYEYQPQSLYYAGTWDASEGSYPSSPEQGQYYICDTNGTVDLIDFTVDDWIVFNGVSWNRIINANSSSGDVIGPESNSDNAISRFNGEDSKTIQGSLVTVDDDGSVNIPSGQSYKINSIALAASDVGAAATTHDHTDLAKLDGSTDFTGGLSRYGTGGTRVIKNLGSFTQFFASGAVKVVLPVGTWNTGIVVLVFRGVTANGNSWEAIAKGQLNDVLDIWESCKVDFSANCPFTSAKIGFDSNKHCVLLGAIGDGSKSLSVSLDTVMVTGDAVGLAWEDAYTFSNITSEDGLTNLVSCDVSTDGYGDVLGPSSTTENNVPQWDEDTKTLKDGLGVGTAANNLVQLDGDAKLPAVDGSQLTNLPSGDGNVLGPESTTENKIPQWDEDTKTLKDGLAIGTGTGTICAGDDSRLSDSRTPADHAASHVTDGGDTIANVVAAGNSGLMSGTDKTKLDGIAESANAYTLPTATDAILGGVKVGDRLNISDGVLSADVQGSGGAYAIVSQSSATYNATQTSGNIIILCDCTSNAITVNLPTAVGNTTTFTIKKTSGNYDITIDGNSTETIDSYLTYPITTLNQSVTIVSNDTNWAIT